MAKNIKDIVDEGFGKLASLAEKRNEILARCEQISHAASGPQLTTAEQRVRAAEANYITEINTQVEHLLTELRQTLAQVAENNQFFQGATRDKLTMHIGGYLDELTQSQTFIRTRAAAKLDSLFQQSNSELKAIETELLSESTRMLSELDLSCERSTAALVHSKAEISGQLAHNQHELAGLLGESANSIIQDAEKKRKKIKEKLEKFGRHQNDELLKVKQDTAKLVAETVKNTLKEMKAACAALEEQLDQKREELYDRSAADLREVSHESLSQLQDSYDFSKKELADKLAALTELTKKLLQQEQTSLTELDNIARTNAETILADLRVQHSDGDAAGAGKRNPVEEAFAEIEELVDEVSDELTRKLKNILKAQAESMQKLCAASEKTLVDLFADFSTQMQENMKVHDQLCAQKEEDLLKQLEKLEKQIVETRAQLSGETGGAK